MEMCTHGEWNRTRTFAMRPKSFFSSASQISIDLDNLHKCSHVSCMLSTSLTCSLLTTISRTKSGSRQKDELALMNEGTSLSCKKLSSRDMTQIFKNLFGQGYSNGNMIQYLAMYDSILKGLSVLDFREFLVSDYYCLGIRSNIRDEV